MPLSAIDFYNSLAKTLASRLKFELCPHEMKMNSQLNCVKCVEAVIREAIEKTQQQERLRLAEEAEKSSYLRLVLADVPKHVALWLRGQA